MLINHSLKHNAADKVYSTNQSLLVSTNTWPQTRQMRLRWIGVHLNSAKVGYHCEL